MATKIREYLIPGKNQIILDQKLADEFLSRLESIKENTYELCLLAAGVKKEYLDPISKNYSQGFKDWWKKFKMDDCFGSASNFSKYASAGELVAKVGKQHPARIKQLPSSMSSLYAISQLEDEEISLCFDHTFSRSSITEPASEWKGVTTKPLIHPQVAASEVLSWKKKWDEPPVKKTDKRTIPFIEIKIHGSIYDLDKDGNQIGRIKVADIKKYVSEVEKVFAGTNDTVLVTSKLNEILQGIENRKDKAKKAKKRAKGTKRKEIPKKFLKKK
jgi:hypothetical protein